MEARNKNWNNNYHIPKDGEQNKEVIVRINNYNYKNVLNEDRNNNRVQGNQRDTYQTRVITWYRGEIYCNVLK